MSLLLLLLKMSTSALFSSSLELPVASGVFVKSAVTVVPVDWYMRSDLASPTGIVWLQHGFMRTKENVASIARAIAVGTDAVVVAVTVSSNPLALSGVWINGVKLHEAVARLFGDSFHALEASARAAGLKCQLPRAFVIVGHSAGGNLAVSASGFSTEQRDSEAALVVTNLRGIVMLDGVDRGGLMAAGLDKLKPHSIPVRTIAAPDCSWNANGSGTKVLKSKRPNEFIGVVLANGSHIDAEAAESGTLAEWSCGASSKANVEALQLLAVVWIRDFFAKSTTPEALAETSAGTVSTLPNGAVATTL